MEVDATSIAALLLLFAILLAAVAARRRAERRREAERVRTRARRHRVPEVSANVRGLPVRPTDLWEDESRACSRSGANRRGDSVASGG